MKGQFFIFPSPGTSRNYPRKLERKKLQIKWLQSLRCKFVTMARIAAKSLAVNSPARDFQDLISPQKSIISAWQLASGQNTQSRMPGTLKRVAILASGTFK